MAYSSGDFDLMRRVNDMRLLGVLWRRTGKTKLLIYSIFGSYSDFSAFL